MKNRWKLVAGALLMALVLAACGGDDNAGGDTGSSTGTTGTTTAATGTSGGGSVSPEEYVKSVCTSMSTWVSDVQNLSNSFGSDVDPTDLEATKNAIVDLFGQMLDATDTLISSLQAAGTPDIDNGDQIKAALSDSFTQARQALSDAKDQIANLDTSDPTQFATQLQGIGTAIQSSMSGITGSLSGLQAPELEQAAANEPACASLAAGASGASGTT